MVLGIMGELDDMLDELFEMARRMDSTRSEESFGKRRSFVLVLDLPNDL